MFVGGSEGLTRDDVLDNITLTWLTNTARLRRPSVLGEQGRVVLRCQGRRGPDRRKRLPRRVLSCSRSWAEQEYQAHSLRQDPQGRALCGLGTAEALSEQVRAGSDRCGGVLPIDVGDALYRPFAIQHRPHRSGPVDDHLQQPVDQHVLVPTTIVELRALIYRPRGGPVREGRSNFQPANPKERMEHIGAKSTSHQGRANCPSFKEILMSHHFRYQTGKGSPEPQPLRLSIY